LGLNAKTGGGSSKMQIDISVLNNSKADKGGGAIKQKKTIDAETGKEI
jgi:predicted outer membrane repeat protein